MLRHLFKTVCDIISSMRESVAARESHKMCSKLHGVRQQRGIKIILVPCSSQCTASEPEYALDGPADGLAGCLCPLL